MLWNKEEVSTKVEKLGIRVSQSCPGNPIFDPLLDSLLAEFGGGSQSNCGSQEPKQEATRS